MLQGFLIQVRTGVLTGRVIFDVPDAPSRGGWSRPAICDRKNILANFSQPEKSFGSYDCLTIEPVSMVRATTASQLAGQFYDYLDVNKIKRPNTAISTAFNISDGRSYLNVSYLFNPDMEKITPVAGSLWHVDRYKEDSKRAAYVEKIKNWAQELRPWVVDGLKGKLTTAPTASVASVAPSAQTRPALTVESPQIGKIYRDTLPLDTHGAPQIVLPPGDWKLAVLGQLQSEREYPPCSWLSHPDKKGTFLQAISISSCQTEHRLSAGRPQIPANARSLWLISRSIQGQVRATIAHRSLHIR